jgi:hypothetical protein
MIFKSSYFVTPRKKQQKQKVYKGKHASPSMTEKRNPCLELMLDSEHQEYEKLAREAVYRETAKQFPKTCSCGKTYRTEEQFTRETEICGPAVNYHAPQKEKIEGYGILTFLRNCECKSTMCLGLDHAQFDSFESYMLFETMRALGEECFKKIKPELINPDFAKTECGKCINQYLTKYDIGRITKDSKESKQDQIHVGLNLFRERYNDWIFKRAQ